LGVFATAMTLLIACSKETSIDTGGNGGPGGGGGGGNNNCTGTAQKLKEFKYLHDTSEYIRISYNTQGKVSSIRYKMLLSEYLIHNFIYENNRIAKSVLQDMQTDNIIDTVVYLYDANGRVDSTYCIRNYRNSMKYTWDASGRLKKITSYNEFGEVHYYADLTLDARGNIIRTDDYLNDSNGGFEKLSKYDMTRDDKNNPFAELAIYMFYLDDEQDIFQLYGPNNFVDETFFHYSNSATGTTGFKYKYNNCYPTKAAVTFMGVPILNEDAYEFVYE